MVKRKKTSQAQKKLAGIAQLVEQRTENPRATSSSLVPGMAKLLKNKSCKPLSLVETGLFFN
jgi:hypothetical protein